MKLETVGHATLVVSGDDGAPILLTDPWLSGSCYWQSWWLERPPAPSTIARLARAPYCYLTHDHPDHFHTDSIETLPAEMTFLTPAFLHDRMGEYLRSRGRKVVCLEPQRWFDLGQGVAVYSIPAFGDDSILVVDTSDAVIVNFNDARPSPLQLAGLRRLVARDERKVRIVLSSYSSAGIANSCFRGDQRLELVSKRTYARYPSGLCRMLGAQYFLPFASGVVLRRGDTRWANDFRVTFADLQEHWAARRTALLPIHATLDLGTGKHTAVDPREEPRDEARIAAAVAAQAERERAAKLTDHDVDALHAKLEGAGRNLLKLLAPRGLGFDLGGAGLCYSPWTGRLERAPAKGSIVLRLPLLPLQEVLESGFMGDLCIPMFTEVRLDAVTDPRAAVALFMQLVLHDVGATTDTASFARWLARGARQQLDVLRAPGRAL